MSYYSPDMPYRVPDGPCRISVWGLIGRCHTWLRFDSFPSALLGWDALRVSVGGREYRIELPAPGLALQPCIPVPESEAAAIAAEVERRVNRYRRFAR